ncbi:MAG: hypothetical protein A3E25_16795 [Burkholderiales bacterium RIFCSPHIGHO2_12_FULL_69_20]|nr:MAG: hypothetical protein A3E25_16795 [Burkholderiales bacterium RIFCSPHIGHO2_12_FULL_69_20]
MTVNYILWRVGRNRVDISGLPALTSGSYDLADAETRQHVHDAVIGWLRGLAQQPAEISAALEQFATAIGLAPDALDLQSRRFDYLDTEELRAIALQGCAIELHGHEHRYPVGQPARLRADILACREFLTSIGLPKPLHYCYPSGEFDDHAESVFEELGIASGTTCLPGLVNPKSPGSLGYLPRFLDSESVTDLEFEAEMSGFLEFVRYLAKRGAAKAPG